MIIIRRNHRKEQSVLELIYFKVPKRYILPSSTRFDEINPKYRRIIVRGEYKVLYREEAEVIIVVDIVSVRQSPVVLKNK